MQTAAQPSTGSYAPPAGAYDEAFESDGTARPHYERVIGALAATDLDELIRTVAADLHSRGVAFKGRDGDAPFRVDPVPRIITAAEWEDLRAGLAQRVKALNAFLVDAYSDRRIVEAGVMPGRVIDTCVHVEPWMADVVVPHGTFAGAAGLDIIRDENGDFRVLEDNLRTPSGYTYLVAARDVLDERLPPAAHLDVESPHDAVERLGAALEAAAPDGIDEPSVVLLSDGPENTAWYEHLTIAHRLDIPIVQLADLRSRYGRLYAWTGRRDVAVDVIYRRTDNDQLMDDDGRPTALAAALLGPMRAGRLAVFNAFGTGIADDKLAHAYVEDMVRFYLGEEPLLPSVETFDLGKPEMLEDALDRIEDMVIKQRTGSGGFGVTIYSHASPEERAAVDKALAERPEDFIAQRRVTLSTHPTAVNGRLVPRHVDLRPFCLSAGDDVDVLPGGLTRVQFDEGVLVVNSSQNGGGKDTWVLT